MRPVLSAPPTAVAEAAAFSLPFAPSPASTCHSLCGLSILRRHVHPTLILSPPPIPLVSFSSFRRCSIADPPWRLRSPSVTRSNSGVSRAVSDAGGGGSFLQDAGATVLVLAGAYALVFVFDILTKRNLIERSLSRKLVHVLSGLLFMASWPIFSTSMEARYFASFVPVVNCFRLVIHGLSLAPNQGLVKSVTREGNPGELLRGPLYYVLILIISALLFWRESPVGVISLAMMCGGDGVADIMGRRFGTARIPYNHKKSWAGSISMFICGFSISIGMLYYFSVLGYFQLDWAQTMSAVALVSLVATVVESLPTANVVDDNISVPLASMVVAFLSFR
ncbi:probable phytol kinase 1, chloroplastic isoform X1 [Malania oleifera]|uniref:probable phytol kinase 1, chloroplastic isoform X1 n=1 Tax=Malania oleifera TaxID=397392 RepID=UPI0025AE39A5|nr:probable phytol kinase 1, chloroplastic isoform X1 [Malania oleifera]